MESTRLRCRHGDPASQLQLPKSIGANAMAGVCRLLVALFAPDVALFLPRLLHP